MQRIKTTNYGDSGYIVLGLQRTVSLMAKLEGKVEQGILTAKVCRRIRAYSENFHGEKKAKQDEMCPVLMKSTISVLAERVTLWDYSA